MNVARVFLAGVLVCAFAAVDVRAATKFKVQTLDDNCCEFSEGQVSALKGKGFTKVVCPFKIACVGTAGYPDAYMQECASLVASLIDVDRDGKVDSAKLQEKVTYHKTTSGPIVVGGTSQSEEDPGELAGGASQPALIGRQRVNHITIVYQYRPCAQFRCIVPAHYTRSFIQC